jgi:hypothetical protein
VPATGVVGCEVGGAPGANGAQDAPEGAGPRDSLIATVFGDGIPTPDTTTMTGAAASAIMSEAAASHPRASTGPASGAPSSPPRMATATTSAGTDNNAIEELEVICGHPGLRAPGVVSLFDVMGTTHFALNQVHDVLHREREDINEERQCLSMWFSLLKQRTTFEKEKAVARQKRLDVMEILYARWQAVADQLDV